MATQSAGFGCQPKRTSIIQIATLRPRLCSPTGSRMSALPGLLRWPPTPASSRHSPTENGSLAKVGEIMFVLRAQSFGKLDGSAMIPDLSELQKSRVTTDTTAKARDGTQQRRAVPKTSRDQRGARFVAACRRIQTQGLIQIRAEITRRCCSTRLVHIPNQAPGSPQRCRLDGRIPPWGQVTF